MRMTWRRPGLVRRQSGRVRDLIAGAYKHDSWQNPQEISKYKHKLAKTASFIVFDYFRVGVEAMNTRGPK